MGSCISYSPARSAYFSDMGEIVEYCFSDTIDEVDMDHFAKILLHYIYFLEVYNQVFSQVFNKFISSDMHLLKSSFTVIYEALENYPQTWLRGYGSCNIVKIYDSFKNVLVMMLEKGVRTSIVCFGSNVSSFG